MRIEISEEELQLIIQAMEHYSAYLESQQHPDSNVEELLTALKQSPRHYLPGR